MTIKIEQIRSPIRRPGNKRAERRSKGPRPSSQRATLIGLRLNRIGRIAELTDTPQICCQIASKSDPFSLARATPSEGAKTGVAQPHIAEQSRS
jgi:ribosomal protein L30/L7E